MRVYINCNEYIYTYVHMMLIMSYSSYHKLFSHMFSSSLSQEIPMYSLSSWQVHAHHVKPVTSVNADNHSWQAHSSHVVLIAPVATNNYCSQTHIAHVIPINSLSLEIVLLFFNAHNLYKYMYIYTNTTHLQIQDYIAYLINNIGLPTHVLII